MNTFDTIEDFWRLFNNLKPPSQLSEPNNFWLFREGIKPAWEDPLNANGGRWRTEVGLDTGRGDDLWMQSVGVMPSCFRLSTLIRRVRQVMATIGETYEHSGCVNGIMAGVRRRSLQRLDIWTDDWKNEQAVVGAGRSLKEVFPSNVKLNYSPHDRSAGGKDKAKSLYSV